MKALSFLKEVQEEITNKVESQMGENFNFFSGKVSSKNPVYSILRKITKQSQRDFIAKQLNNFLLKKKLDYYSVDTEPLIKNYAIDYVDYIYAKDPSIPEKYYSGKKDVDNLHTFLKAMIYGAYLDKIPYEILGLNNVKIWEKANKEKDKISVKNGYFEYHGFKSVLPTFENLYSDHGLKLFNKKKHKIAIDLGAFIGDTAYLIYKVLKPDKIYAFEPEKNNLMLLRETISMNHLESVVLPVELATGKENGKLYFQSMGGASQFKDRNQPGAYEVNVKTIDNFMKDENISKLDLIKMDIEGSEFDTLKGAVRTLKKDKPDLVITIYHKGEHFFELPGFLKRTVPEYNLRFFGVSSTSPILERCIFASTEKI